MVEDKIEEGHQALFHPEQPHAFRYHLFIEVRGGSGKITRAVASHG